MDNCYNKALKMLVRREHSVLELEQKLTLKEFGDEEIKESIQLLQEQGFQSDERFTEAFIQMRFNQGKGPVKIKGELRQRGIHSFDLSQYDWFELALVEKIKKYGEENPDELKEISKQKRFLQSRGFDFEHINAIY